MKRFLQILILVLLAQFTLFAYLFLFVDGFNPYAVEGILGLVLNTLFNLLLICFLSMAILEIEKNNNY